MIQDFNKFTIKDKCPLLGHLGDGNSTFSIRVAIRHRSWRLAFSTNSSVNLLLQYFIFYYVVIIKLSRTVPADANSYF